MAELIDLKELEERVILIAVNVGDERETSASLDGRTGSDCGSSPHCKDRSEP